MSNAEDLIPFVRTGGILATIPNWRDIPEDTHRTIREYYPNDEGDFTLTLVMRPDPQNPDGYILQYDEPFGKSWTQDAKDFLTQLEFEYDDHPKHQFLNARNTATVRLHKKPPDNWEVARFRISMLPGGQLSVWTYWEREDKGKEGGKDTYRAGYVWPPC